MGNLGVEWDAIERHCVPYEMYDDGGYCDTEIPRLGKYYVISCGEGCEIMCTECVLSALLNQLREGGKVPSYKDCWFEDFDVITGKSRV